MNKKRILQNALALACFVAACNMSRQTESSSTFMQLTFDKEGHRGCRGLMPENTIPAMITALDLGVTTLEMDVVISKDQQVVLSHDPFFNHDISTINPGQPNAFTLTAAQEVNYRIFNMDYADISKIDVGLKPHPRFPQQQKIAAIKPLLSELIDSVEQHVAKTKRALPFYNIETKTTPAGDNTLHPPPAAFVDLLIGLIRKKGIEDRVIIQSFDFRTLKYLHEKYPKYKTALLIEDFDKRPLDQQLEALGFIPTIYSPAHQLVGPELVKACHDKKMKIVPWTVNDKPRIDTLRKMGVDGIISDYPGLLN